MQREFRTTDSEIRKIRFMEKLLYRVSQNKVYGRWKWFCDPKIWTFDLALIITQNRHLFESLSSKKLWWNKENCAPPKCYKITMKICVFSWKSGKRWQFCVLVSIKVDGHVFRDKKSFIYFLDPILGHPVYQFLPKPEFSDFTVISYGLPLSFEFWKYMSLCWSNLCFLANAPGGHGPYYFKYRSLLRCLYSTICGNKSWY